MSGFGRGSLSKQPTMRKVFYLVQFFSNCDISRFENSFTSKIVAALLLPCCDILTHSLKTLLLLCWKRAGVGGVGVERGANNLVLDSCEISEIPKMRF